MSKYLIKPIEFKLSGAQNGKRAPRTLQKHYLHKVFEVRFREAAKPYKTNGKSTFSSHRKSMPETLQNQSYFNSISSKIRKIAPKTLKKHYLHKVFALRFREAAKPYKTNEKSTFPSMRDSKPETL